MSLALDKPRKLLLAGVAGLGVWGAAAPDATGNRLGGKGLLAPFFDGAAKALEGGAGVAIGIGADGRGAGPMTKGEPGGFDVVRVVRARAGIRTMGALRDY